MRKNEGSVSKPKDYFFAVDSFMQQPNLQEFFRWRDKYLSTPSRIISGFLMSLMSVEWDAELEKPREGKKWNQTIRTEGM